MRGDKDVAEQRRGLGDLSIPPMLGERFLLPCWARPWGIREDSLMSQSTLKILTRSPGRGQARKSRAGDACSSQVTAGGAARSVPPVPRRSRPSGWCWEEEMPSLQHSPCGGTVFFPGMSCKEKGPPRPRSPRSMSRWRAGSAAVTKPSTAGPRAQTCVD